MSKFEWMELETASNEVAHLQSRLDAARATKNHGMVRLLEREIAEATERRGRLLSDITKGLNVVPSGLRLSTQKTADKAQPEQAEAEQQESAHAETPTTIATGDSLELAVDPQKTEGVSIVWDRVTAADIERAKRGFVARRSEILARHAEELKALETEQAEIEVIEQAIAAFTRKFKLAGCAEVVPFDQERAPAEAG